MKFEMPRADRARLEQLLEYLGDTSRYSDYYDGNRAEDFKKCFDIESEWCWKYADLMLRGMEKRDLEYAEGHHVVPKSFYRCGHGVNKGKRGNMTTLSYPEHTYAHYCAYRCATTEISNKLLYAFISMCDRGVGTGKIPSDDELVEYLSDIDIYELKLRLPHIKKLEETGRHHYWEVSDTEYNREYREFNKDAIRKREKQFYEMNKDRICERQRKYNEGKREDQKQYSREWRLAHPEQCKTTLHNYYVEHKDELAEYKREYNLKNKDVIAERNRLRREANHDEIINKERERYAKNREHILEQKKVYQAEHREEIKIKNKKYRDENRDVLISKARERYKKNCGKYLAAKKEHYTKMVAAGYKIRKDPVTGKRGWVFVGLPKQEVAA